MEFYGYYFDIIGGKHVGMGHFTIPKNATDITPFIKNHNTTDTMVKELLIDTVQAISPTMVKRKTSITMTVNAPMLQTFYIRVVYSPKYDLSKQISRGYGGKDIVDFIKVSRESTVDCSVDRVLGSPL